MLVEFKVTGVSRHIASEETTVIDSGADTARGKEGLTEYEIITLKMPEIPKGQGAYLVGVHEAMSSVRLSSCAFSTLRCSGSSKSARRSR